MEPIEEEPIARRTRSLDRRRTLYANILALQQQHRFRTLFALQQQQAANSGPNSINGTEEEHSTKVQSVPAKRQKKSKASKETQSKATQSDSVLQCGVCRENYLNRAPTTTACGHIYCNGCIFKWLQVRADCPKCHKFVMPEELIRLFV